MNIKELIERIEEFFIKYFHHIMLVVNIVFTARHVIKVGHMTVSNFLIGVIAACVSIYYIIYDNN